MFMTKPTIMFKIKLYSKAELAMLYSWQRPSCGGEPLDEMDLQV